MNKRSARKLRIAIKLHMRHKAMVNALAGSKLPLGISSQIVYDLNTLAHLILRRGTERRVYNELNRRELAKALDRMQHTLATGFRADQLNMDFGVYN